MDVGGLSIPQGIVVMEEHRKENVAKEVKDDVDDNVDGPECKRDSSEIRSRINLRNRGPANSSVNDIEDITH
jgi:hypothetical protein